MKKMPTKNLNFPEENLVVIEKCEEKEENIYLKINNCIVTKYQGSLTVTTDN